MSLKSAVSPEAPSVTFAQKLRQLMDERKLSVRKLATLSGVKFGTVASYLVLKDGEPARLPTLANAIKLAKALGVSVAVFEECSDYATGSE